jgi:predicted RNase H-like HicB family nuclease
MTMAKKTYAAMFEPAEEGYGITFPDLPGCVSFGEDLDACMRQAHEALTLHLEGMAEDGEVPPDATPLRDLVARMNNPPGHVWASIEVEAPDSAERVNVYLPRSLLDRVDRYVAERAPMNRSTFFTEAARLRLEMSQAAAQLRFDSAPH